jgi:hypothetical protein
VRRYGNSPNDSILLQQIDYSGTKFSDIAAGWEGSVQVPAAGALQVLFFVGFLEIAVMKDITGGEFVGDFRVS